MTEAAQQVGMTDEQIENIASIVERAEAYAQLEGLTMGDACRRMLRFWRTMAQLDAKVADNKQAAVLMNASMPTGKPS